MIRTVLIALLALTATSLAQTTPQGAEPHRDYDGWVSSRIGGGGYIVDVIPDPSVKDRWYATIDVGGFYRSDDDGVTWHAVHQNLPEGLGDIYSIGTVSVHPTNPSDLIITTGTRWRAPGGIWRSTDEGETWDLVQPSRFWNNANGRQDGSKVVRHPDNPDVVLAGGAGAFYRSEDGGATWDHTGPSGMLVTDIYFDQNDSDRVWMMASAEESWAHGGQFVELDAGFWFSSDAGKTWVQLADAGPTEITQDPGDPSRLIGLFDTRVRASTDDGQSWQDISGGLPADAGGGIGEWRKNTFRGIGTGPDFTLTVGGQGDVYKLDAGVNRWQTVPRQSVNSDEWWYGNHDDDHGGWSHYGKAAASITVDPDDEDRWFMSDWYSVWRTEDAGQNWELSVDGIESTVIHMVVPDPDDPNIVHLGMCDNGYLRSTDGGLSFTKIAMPGNMLYSNVKGIALTPDNANRLYAIGNRNPGQWESSTMAVSDNKGESFYYPQMRGLPGALTESLFINSVIADPNDADTVFVTVSGQTAQGGGVYRSIDAGDNWQLLGSGLPGGVDLFESSIWNSGPQLAITLDGTLFAISGVTNQVYALATSEQNASWQVVWDAQGNPQMIAAATRPVDQGPQVFLAAGDGGLLTSADGGATWEQILADNTARVSVYVDDLGAMTIAAGTDTGVKVSYDFGESFVDVTGKLPYRHFPIPGVTSTNLHVGTLGNGVYTTRLEPGGNALRGDFNRDGRIDDADIDLLVLAIINRTGETIDPIFDLDGNDHVDQNDLDELVLNILQTAFGDADLNGSVNLLDLSVLASNFNRKAGWAGGNFSGDDKVNLLDLSLLAASYSTTNIPSPTTAAILTFGSVVRLAARTESDAAPDKSKQLFDVDG
ncbi:hypothetical protein [Mucisphaera calidilacus]|uniref:Xyloglucanase n=1 Tax=Mucisphaera calidilacus TaxID=2527982 RepID=A0A518BX06_9BACT|nr:hypothetical protein [Mucisphaera calidilacus]QDU71513.1 Xyloglucanase precursor [Mucisphaera calidilacus]